jgi:hypothetical protein
MYVGIGMLPLPFCPPEVIPRGRMLARRRHPGARYPVCAYTSMWAHAFGGGSGAEFHENGRLKSCKLSRTLLPAYELGVI